MNDKCFSLRASETLLEKVGLIAKCENRTKNKQIVNILQDAVLSYENLHGPLKRD